MTAGRAVLLRVLQIIPAREVALRVHVSEMAVSYWRAGLHSPSASSRALLEQHLRIPAGLWDVPAVKRQSTLRSRY